MEALEVSPPLCTLDETQVPLLETNARAKVEVSFSRDLRLGQTHGVFIIQLVIGHEQVVLVNTVTGQITER